MIGLKGARSMTSSHISNTRMRSCSTGVENIDDMICQQIMQIYWLES